QGSMPRRSHLTSSKPWFSAKLRKARNEYRYWHRQHAKHHSADARANLRRSRRFFDSAVASAKRAHKLKQLRALQSPDRRFNWALFRRYRRRGPTAAPLCDGAATLAESANNLAAHFAAVCQLP